MSREKRDGSFVRKRQEGSAMVVVMCVMLITTILCLELLLAASASARNIRRIGERTQCRVNAYSVSGVLIDEITGAPEYGDVTEDGALREDGNSVRSQLQTAFHKIENGERRLGEKLEYELAPGTLPGETMVDLYWLDEGGDTDETSEEIRSVDAFSRPENAVLCLKVTSTVGGESSTVYSYFKPDAQADTEAEDGGGDEEQSSRSFLRLRFIGHMRDRG